MKPPTSWHRCENLKALYGTDMAGGGTKTTFVAGKFGNGMNIPADLDASVTWQVAIAAQGALSFWFKPNGWSCTDGKTISTRNTFGYEYSGATIQFQNGGTCYMGMGTSANRYIYGSAANYNMTDGNWYHHLWTWILASSTYHFYLNNTEITLGSPAVTGTAPTGTYTSYIGSRAAAAEKAPGIYDDIKIFDYVPSAIERQRIMNAERGCMNDA